MSEFLVQLEFEKKRLYYHGERAKASIATLRDKQRNAPEPKSPYIGKLIRIEERKIIKINKRLEQIQAHFDNAVRRSIKAIEREQDLARDIEVLEGKIADLVMQANIGMAVSKDGHLQETILELTENLKRLKEKHIKRGQYRAKMEIVKPEAVILYEVKRKVARKQKKDTVQEAQALVDTEATDAFNQVAPQHTQVSDIGIETYKQVMLYRAKQSTQV